MSDNNDWRKSLVEALTGPMIAVLFWFTMIVLVVFALAHGKAFEANIFEALGAIGQLAIAAAVFWVAVQQFRFTKQVTERQRHIDLYPFRQATVEKLQEAIDSLTLDSSITETSGAFNDIQWDVSRLFSEKASDLAFELYEQAEHLRALYLTRLDGTDDIAAAADAYRHLEREYEAFMDWAIELMDELRLEMAVR